MENKRDISGCFINLFKNVKMETLPVFWIDAMDISNTSSKEINAKGNNLLAFFWIGNFTISGDAIFCATDCTDFRFNGDAFGMS